MCDKLAMNYTRNRRYASFVRRLLRGRHVTTAKAAASLLIELASGDAENDLTNLKLQKILYFAQVESWRRRAQRLFDDPIEAWQYGPVVRDVYQWLKGCGPYAISYFDVDIDSTSLSDEEAKFLREIWDRYSKYSASYLVRKTHEAGTPWRVTFDENRDKVIPEDRLKRAPVLR